MLKKIVKRDGRMMDYDIKKIEVAISKAMNALGDAEINSCKRLAKVVETNLKNKFNETTPPSVENIQDEVEKVLMENGYTDVAKAYILYRDKRNKVREASSNLMKTYCIINSIDDNDLKRSNANIDGSSPMGAMLQFGTEGAKDFFDKYFLTPEFSKAHKSGDIHIHDFDFYTLTLTCCQIDIKKLFEGGFSTGHGFLREPSSIRSYTALAAIAIQANQNDQHGGQSIPNFDYSMAVGVMKSYRNNYYSNFAKAYEVTLNKNDAIDEIINKFKKLQKEKNIYPTIDKNENFDKAEKELFPELSHNDFAKIKSFAEHNSLKETNNDCYQAMEAFVHNLNSMHSRAGAQVPFSSINFGLDTSSEGRMVIKNILLATEAGLGFGETPIFPISIFRVKEGVNYNPEDFNYDLFKLACKVSAKRLFPNFSFVDAPFNLKYYKPGKPETEVAYMGCRTRVLGNVYDPSHEISFGRGNLSFTTLNLPRLAIEAKGNINKFYLSMDKMLDLIIRQMKDRMKIQGMRQARNFPFLMRQGIWLDSEKLKPTDTIAEVIKHGTLSVGFIGLAEALVALTGKHHGENIKSRKLGLEIVKYMRDYLDKLSKKEKLNYTLLATPAEGLSGRFTRIDKKIYGEIKGVTDKDYYTNSFHVPVSYPLTAFEKIDIEAPYHNFCNAGHITYIELDGNTTQNVDAFEKIIRHMKEAGIGYGAINHPVDHDPVCGYNGIIGDTCPKCGRKDGSNGINFSRIRRITGYLVGTLERFNDGKKAEERDRVKHGINNRD